MSMMFETFSNASTSTTFNNARSLSISDDYQPFSENLITSSFFESDFGSAQKNAFAINDQHQLNLKFQQPYKLKAKTELCKNYILNGECKFSDKCCFAHGKEELKAKINLPENYKTKPCKQYFTQGYCPYGNRCQYLHSEIKKIPTFNLFLQNYTKSKNIICLNEDYVYQKYFQILSLAKNSKESEQVLQVFSQAMHSNQNKKRMNSFSQFC